MQALIRDISSARISLRWCFIWRPSGGAVAESLMAAARAAFIADYRALNSAFGVTFTQPWPES